MSTATATVTSSSAYPGDVAVATLESTADIPAAVAQAVETLAPRERSHQPRARKRNQPDSHSRSPPEARKTEKRVLGTGSLDDELRDTTTEWQDRAVRAENELRFLRAQYSRAIAEHQSAVERWTHDREALVADELNSRAAARKYKFQRNDAGKQVKSLTEEVDELRTCVSQLTDANQVPTKSPRYRTSY